MSATCFVYYNLFIADWQIYFIFNSKIFFWIERFIKELLLNYLWWWPCHWCPGDLSCTPLRPAVEKHINISIRDHQCLRYLPVKGLCDPLDCNHLKPQLISLYLRVVYSGMDDHTVGWYSCSVIFQVLLPPGEGVLPWFSKVDRILASSFTKNTNDSVNYTWHSAGKFYWTCCWRTRKTFIVTAALYIPRVIWSKNKESLGLFSHSREYKTVIVIVFPPWPLWQYLASLQA